MRKSIGLIFLFSFRIHLKISASFQLHVGANITFQLPNFPWRANSGVWDSPTLCDGSLIISAKTVKV